jgi:hypothetical protein
MFLQRLAVLALVGLVGGGYASARNSSLSLQPVLAPPSPRTATTPPHVVPAAPPPVHVRVQRSVPHRVDPLEAFCRDARRLRADYEARRPPNGSPASVYIAFLGHGARLERGLAQRLGRLHARGPRSAQLRRRAARRVTLALALVDAAKRRDARAYWKAAAALADAPAGCAA